MTGRTRVVLLGATGSIGQQALDVMAAHAERFEVVSMAAGKDGPGLEALADRFGVGRVALADRQAAGELAARRNDLDVLDGEEGVVELAGDDADIVLNGITGAAGLAATLAALARPTVVALANKESLIVGGRLVISAADLAGGRERWLVPVDSEHSALAQCLRSGRRDEVSRLILTASGGPFRGRKAAEMADATAAEALAHPTWEMGPVITVNSATLFNKGLELIEAHELFDIDWNRLDVVVHPQSVVHSMVEFIDGSTIAQMSPPDMRLPIQLALGWPDRLDHAPARCDWTNSSTLTFEPVDRVAFQALDVAERASRHGCGTPAVMNAANEVAVAAFLEGRTRFGAIIEIVADTVDRWIQTDPGEPRDLAEVMAADAWGRRQATEMIQLEASR
ncbi:MAG: 1-deoxy-D-xylulose-5-phosphate reductoisomerase [Nitriliruptoraceae bacterium]